MDYQTLREREIEDMPMRERVVAKDNEPDTMYFYSLIYGLATSIEAACNVIVAQAKAHAPEISAMKEKITGSDEMAAVKRLFAMAETAKEMRKNAKEINDLFHSRIF